jgi:hypothetical protein
MTDFEPLDSWSAQDVREYDFAVRYFMAAITPPRVDADEHDEVLSAPAGVTVH